LYLTAALDLFTRESSAGTIKPDMTPDIAMDALTMPRSQRFIPTAVVSMPATFSWCD